MWAILTENYLLFVYGLMMVILAAMVGLLFWYIRRLVFKLLSISDKIEDLVVMIKSYSNHLKSVYELETFYGDETLHSLLKHTGHVLEELNQYETVEQLIEGEENYDFYEQEDKKEK